MYNTVFVRDFNDSVYGDLDYSIGQGLVNYWPIRIICLVIGMAMNMYPEVQRVYVLSLLFIL